MNYPLISEYIEAIKSSEDNFEKLNNLRPMLDEDGEPIMSSGNFAVVFKMIDEKSGKLHAVKCFLKEQEGRAEAYRMIAEELEYVSSTFLVPIKYLEKELFVDSNNSDETEFPVLLMAWVEGITLDKYIREHLDDQYELSLLAYQFSRLAMWLMPQPFAHGDLKPDNILVKDDGTLVLVDYDGMYVPAMKGQKARELGSPDFRHPSRIEDDFDEHIDDFSLASILLSLKAISLQPSLLEEYGDADRLLFSAKDYRDLSKCEILWTLHSLVQDKDLSTLLSLFNLAVSLGNLSQVSFQLFNLSRPNKLWIPKEFFSTEVSEEDISAGLMDEYGVIYSKDGKRLLKATENINYYSIKKGVTVICDNAFRFYEEYDFDGTIEEFPISNLVSLTIPKSVKIIGKCAFKGCTELKSINIPPYIRKISDWAFCDCKSIQDIFIPKNIKEIGLNPFGGCGNMRIKSDSELFKADEYALYNCKKKSIISVYNYTPDFSIPDCVNEIEDYAFDKCNVTNIIIPLNIKKLGSFAFSKCRLLQTVTIDGCITEARYAPFGNCHNDSLRLIQVPDGDYSHYVSLFHKYMELVEECSSVQTSVMEKDIISALKDECGVLYSVDGKKLLKVTRCLSEYTVKKGTEIICDNAFVPSPGHSSCLKKVILSNSVVSIGNAAFGNNSVLEYVFIGKKVKQIGNNPFVGCKKLCFIDCLSNAYHNRGPLLLDKGNNMLISCLNRTKDNAWPFMSFAKWYLEQPYSGISIGYPNDENPFGMNDNKGDKQKKVIISWFDVHSQGGENLYISFGSDVKELTPKEFKEQITDLIVVTDNSDEVHFREGYIKYELHYRDYIKTEPTVSISLPKELKSISETALGENEDLQKITFQSKVDCINDKLFEGCSSLERISIQHEDREAFEQLSQVLKSKLEERIGLPF